VAVEKGTKTVISCDSLAITTDFRRVLGEAVDTHLGNKALDQVFPGFANLEAKFLRYLA